MKKIMRLTGLSVSFGLALVVGACGFDGQPVITDDFVTVVSDDAELSLRVKQALRDSPQTAVLNIDVSTISEDSVRLSGFVSNDATIYEAERIANGVPGVRIVVNTLIAR